MSDTNVKKVLVTLAALTRVEYSEVVEVPADMTEAELDRLVQQRYAVVDGGSYTPDPEYWQRSDLCRHEPEEADSVADCALTRGPGSIFTIVALAQSSGVNT